MIHQNGVTLTQLPSAFALQALSTSWSKLLRKSWSSDRFVMLVMRCHAVQSGTQLGHVGARFSCVAASDKPWVWGREPLWKLQGRRLPCMAARPKLFPSPLWPAAPVQRWLAQDLKKSEKARHGTCNTSIKVCEEVHRWVTLVLWEFNIYIYMYIDVNVVVYYIYIYTHTYYLL